MKAWIILLLGVFVILLKSANCNKKIVCYLGSWSTYRPGDGKFEVEDIDPFLCTHVIYTFVGIGTDGSIRILDSWQEIDKGGFRRFNALREKNPNLKTLVAIGGWNEGSTKYSTVMNNDNTRRTFVNNVVKFIQTYGFDGFDLDWEYPGQRGGAASDKAAFVKLIQELRAEFDKYGYILSAAVAAAKSSAEISYNIPELGRYLDFINIMTYDLHGSWEAKSGHNAPLYAGPDDVTQNEKLLNVDACISYWVSQGVPKEKIIVGMGTYGRTFTLASSSYCAIGVPTVGAGTAGPYTREAGMLGYNEFCERQSSWSVYWDDQQKVPYACSGNQFVGFDGPESIKIKSQYVVNNGLGGAMIWSLETDDFRGKCHGHKFPLLSAINEAFGGEIEIPQPGTTKPPSEVTPTNPPVPTDPPTNPPAGNPCTQVGFIRAPGSCRVFYYCQAVGVGQYVAHRFECQSGLYYDPRLNICNWPYLVNCPY